MQQEPGNLPDRFQITDEDVDRSRPAVRALWVSRSEALWAPVQRALDDDGASEFPVDPRMLEIGLRIAKLQMDLYGVSRPRPAPPAEDDDEDIAPGVDRRVLVEDKLKQIEDRLRSK